MTASFDDYRGMGISGNECGLGLTLTSIVRELVCQTLHSILITDIVVMQSQFVAELHEQSVLQNFHNVLIPFQPPYHPNFPRSFACRIT